MRTRTHRRSALLLTGLVLAAALTAGSAAPAHAWFGEKWFDGDCENAPIELTPCELDTDGRLATNEGKCIVGVESSGFDGYAPVTGTFSVYTTHWQVADGITFEFDDGTKSWPVTATYPTTFERTFTNDQAGKHWVKVTLNNPNLYGCPSVVHEFTVRPTATIDLTYSPVVDQPHRVQLHASANVDGQDLTDFNWTFDGGTSIDCPGWCNIADPVVELPGMGTYVITASPTLGGTGLKKAIIVTIGEHGPLPLRLPPIPDQQGSTEGAIEHHTEAGLPVLPPPPPPVIATRPLTG